MLESPPWQALGLLRSVSCEGSMELAIEEAKLARLKFNARADVQAAAALLQAAASLDLHGEHDEARELRRLSHLCSR